MKNPALRPTEHGEDDKYIVKSWGVTFKEIKASTKIAVPDAANIALKVDFQFEGGRPAAALVMYKPGYISLPKDERIINLLKSRPDVPKGKYVVTEVISCAAYVMYMSNQKAESFSVTLKATGPVMPAVHSGGAASFSWSSETICGLYREGSDLETPLTTRAKRTKYMMRRCMVTSAFSMMAILITMMTYDHPQMLSSLPQRSNRVTLYIKKRHFWKSINMYYMNKVSFLLGFGC